MILVDPLAYAVAHSVSATILAPLADYVTDPIDDSLAATVTDPLIDHYTFGSATDPIPYF